MSSSSFSNARLCGKYHKAETGVNVLGQQRAFHFLLHHGFAGLFPFIHFRLAFSGMPQNSINAGLLPAFSVPNGHVIVAKDFGEDYDGGMLRHLFCVITIFCLLAHRAQAQGGADDKYVFIYTLIQEGDGLKKKGDAKGAADRYAKAEEGLQSLKTMYPDWNKKRLWITGWAI